MPKLVGLLFIVIALTSCQHSPRKHYFVLTALAPTASHAPQTLAQPITNMIGMGPIEVADYLKRPQLVAMDAQSSRNQVELSDQNYWAEPLEKGIARVLTLNLTQVNSARSFSNFPWRSDNKPIYSLRLQIHSLDYINSQASLNATWELIDNTNKASIQRRHFRETITSAAGPDGVVLAYSQLLTALAAELDRALSQLP